MITPGARRRALAPGVPPVRPAGGDQAGDQDGTAHRRLPTRTPPWCIRLPCRRFTSGRRERSWPPHLYRASEPSRPPSSMPVPTAAVNDARPAGSRSCASGASGRFPPVPARPDRAGDQQEDDQREERDKHRSKTGQDPSQVLDRAHRRGLKNHHPLCLPSARTSSAPVGSQAQTLRPAPEPGPRQDNGVT